MHSKRLSEAEDAVLMEHAARLERALFSREKQWPALCIFLIVAVLMAAYETLVGFFP